MGHLGPSRREGEIRRLTGECSELEDTEGLHYALLDLPAGDYDPEARMIIEGRITDGAVCGLPMAIEVVRVR